MYQLRQLVARLQRSVLADRERKLMKSVLGIGQELAHTFTVSVRRVFPEYAALPHTKWFGLTQYWQRKALDKIKYALELPLPEFLMLCELDGFYKELAGRFPNRSYQEVEVLARRFKGNRGVFRGKKVGPSPLSLNTLQIRVADIMIGLNGKMVEGGMYDVTRALFPKRDTTNRAVRPMYQAIKGVPLSTYRKIERVWQLTEGEYQELLATDPWYRKLAKVFSSRTPEALATIRSRLIRPPVPHAERSQKPKLISIRTARLREQKKLFAGMVDTPLWSSLSEVAQKLVSSYYGLDLEGEEIRGGLTVAKSLGITRSAMFRRLREIKAFLKWKDPSLPFDVKPKAPKTKRPRRRVAGKARQISTPYERRTLFERYRQEVWQFPEMEDGEIQEVVNQLGNGYLEPVLTLFHLGLREILPVAYGWNFERVERETGFEALDVIQEGNIGLWRALRRFSGQTRDAYLEFVRSTAREGIKDGLRRAGMSIGHTNPLTARNIRRIHAATRRIREELDQEPNVEELALELGMLPEDVEEAIAAMRISIRPQARLDSFIRKDEEKRRLYDIVPDVSAKPPEKVLSESARELRERWLAESVEQALRANLSPIEQHVLALRCGFVGEPRTHFQIAQSIGASENVVRLIEDDALQKIRSDPDVIEKIRRYAERPQVTVMPFQISAPISADAMRAAEELFKTPSRKVTYGGEDTFVASTQIWEGMEVNRQALDKEVDEDERMSRFAEEGLVPVRAWYRAVSFDDDANGDGE